MANPDLEQISLAAADAQQQSPYSSGILVSYKTDWRTLLRTSFISLARFCGIMGPLTDSLADPFLEFRSIDKSKPTGFEHIDSFCTALQQLYTSHKTHKLNKDRWKITSVSTYKDTNNTAKHEYLLATAKHGSHVVYMRIERRLQMPTAGAGSINLAGSLSSPSASGADLTGSDMMPVSSGATIGKWSKLASDEIKFSKQPFGTTSDAQVDAIEFAPEADMTLARLAVLVQCVHRSAARYHLLARNCYWFAHVTVEALKALQGPTACISSAPQDKGKQGTWGLVPASIFYRDKTEVIDGVVKAFPEKWMEFLSEVRE